MCAGDSMHACTHVAAGGRRRPRGSVAGPTYYPSDHQLGKMLGSGPNDFDDGHENGDDAVGNDDDDDDGSQGSVGVHGTVAAHHDVSQSQLRPTSL